MRIIANNDIGVGGYLLIAGDQVIYYETYLEASKYMNKIMLVKKIVEMVQTLKPIMDNAPDLVEEHWDEVNANGAFTDELLAPTSIDLATYNGCLALLGEITKFFKGEVDAEGHSTVFPTVYRITVNKVNRVNIP